MADLDTLRPEVREAINRQDRQKKCDEYCPVCEDRATIRAELLRLTDDCARLVDCINAQPPTRRSLIDRAERAEAELAIAQNTIDAQQDTMGAMKRKLAIAEAELEALKARIADSPIASLVYGQGDLLAVISAENPDDWAGKRVRLVEVE